MNRANISKNHSGPDRDRTDNGAQKVESSPVKTPPSFPTDCDNDLFSKKIPQRPDEPISIEDLTRAKSDVRGIRMHIIRDIKIISLLENVFIQDMFVMDQLNELSDRIKNLRVTAKSRTDTSVELGLVRALLICL